MKEYINNKNEVEDKWIFERGKVAKLWNDQSY